MARMADNAEEQLRSLEAALATATHDLRTPLSVVHTTTSMLLNPKYNLGPEQVREQHERIRRNVDLMNRILGDLVDMVHLRSGKLALNSRSVRLDEVLREAVTAQEAPARDKGLQLSFDGNGDELQAQADPARLAQLFQKLLGNAIELCKSGDRIQVSSRRLDGQAHIDIVDSGPGTSPEDESFLKSRAGMSLLIARGIVDAHGGKIACIARPGAGTTFNITLPLAADR
jgi:signal transduction histidine kinase